MMPARRPNVLMILTDDHAAHALSCYGSRINTTPHLDRIAAGGMRFDNCFCTNSICAPSRASILTGTYPHVHGVTTLCPPFDNRLETFPKVLQRHGYRTALFGKWHLGEGPEHRPTGFDDWAVLPGQGRYFNPIFLEPGADGEETRGVKRGYVTDVITDLALDWLRGRDAQQPFCLLVHHKAPHRPWLPDERHAHLYLDETVPEPETLLDDYRNRGAAAAAAHMRVGVHMTMRDLKCEVPVEFPEDELRRFAYQRYIKDYLRVVASVDDNVGRLLDYLDEAGLAEDTVVVYSSDQGFFLGDHGWYDKRFMYEESLRMPFLVRYPREVAAGTVNGDIVTNVDFAPLFLDLAGIPAPAGMQGRSFRPLLRGETPADWPQAMYYRYWAHNTPSHHVHAHYGIRTRAFKLIYYYGVGSDLPDANGEPTPPEWELFDLRTDPRELNNVYHDPAYAAVVRELTAALERLQREVGDTPVGPSTGAGT